MLIKEAEVVGIKSYQNGKISKLQKLTFYTILCYVMDHYLNFPNYVLTKPPI